MKIDTLRSGGQSQGGLDASGGTLSGPLMLSRDPQVALEAATKRYVDNGIQALNASNIIAGTLPIARLPAFSGDITSEAGQNTMSLSNTGVTAGEYGKVVVDAKGRVTNGTGVGNTDIPNISFDKITTGKPTTLAGYGITDAVSISGGVMTGDLILSSNPGSGEHMVSKQYVDGMTNSLSAAKTGDIVRKAYSTTPTGFLKCNGAEISKTTYSDLYAILGESNKNYSIIGSGQPWQQQYEFNKSQSVDINSWTTTTSLPISLTYSSSIVTKNRVYLFGGYNGTGWINTIYTAPINADGTLGAWSTSGTLPIAWGVQKAIVIKNRVYLLGGYTNGTTTTNNMAMATINIDGTIGTFVNVGTLPDTLGWTQCILTNSRIYLVAGYNQANSLTNVIYSASISSDGTFGAWVTETPFPVSVGAGSLAIIKNKAYYFGGVVSFPSTITNSIYVSTINADGTLGAWSLSSSVLPTAISSSQSFVTNSRIYLITGALTASTFTGNIFSAPINADGTLGTWETQTGAISTGFVSGQLIVTNSKIYMLGGHNTTGTPTNTVSVANINGGKNDYSAYYTEDTTNYLMPGSGRPWEQQYQIATTQNSDITGWTAGTAFPIVVTYAQVFVTKNRVYHVGGYDGTNTLSQVYTASINSDGTLGSWSAGTSLPIGLAGHRCIVTKNKVYLLGGVHIASAVRYNTIYTAPINADGTIGTWTLSSTTLPISSEAFSPFITKDKLYIVGGYNSNGTSVVNTVYYTTINSDGTLGTWVAGFSLPAAEAWHSVAIVRNKVFLIGGQNISTALNSVYSATINENGVLSRWSTEQSLPFVLSAFNIFVTNNVIYLIGGNSNGSKNTVYRATVSLGGTLSAWTAGTTLLGNRHASETFVVKNKIYVVAGYDVSIINRVEYAIISDGLNDYSSYYDGSIIPLEPINPTTTFKLPDMSSTDINGIYHYIKY